jgi:hypothetical protein
MSQEKTNDKQIRMNAPTYMRPQHPVLDEPLDIDAGKRAVLQPARMSTQPEMEVRSTVVTAETPVAMTDMAAAVESEVVEAVPAADVPVLDEAVSTLPQETPATTGPEVEVASEPAPEAEADSKPRRKQMTVFQQILVFLLLLVVAAFLATIYLYTKGWIELPTAVLNVVEKGLSLIQ